MVMTTSRCARISVFTSRGDALVSKAANLDVRLLHVFLQLLFKLPVHPPQWSTPSGTTVQNSQRGARLAAARHMGVAPRLLTSER